MGLSSTLVNKEVATKSVLLVLLLLACPCVVAGECDCPPKTDWTILEKLWWELAEETTEQQALWLISAFSVSDTVRIPDDHLALLDAIDALHATVVASIAEQQ
jgi:hypothetical protein